MGVGSAVLDRIVELAIDKCRDRVALPERAADRPHRDQPGCAKHVCNLRRSVRPAHRHRGVIAGQSVPGEEVADEPRSEPAGDAPVEVVDHDPEASHARHLPQKHGGIVRFEMMDDERGVGDVERTVGIPKVAAVADVELEVVDGRDRGVREDRSDQDFGSRIDGDHPQATAARPRAIDQGDRNVRPAGPDVDQRQLVPVRGERFDRRHREVDAAQPTVDPAEIAQIAGQGRLVVERSVEQFDRIGKALHPAAGYTTLTPTMPSMIVVSGEALIDRLVRPDGSVVEVPGGGPFNTARTLARLGARVAFLGCISTDRHGRALRSLLEVDGVDMSLATTTDAPSTVAVAHLDVRGGATYRFEAAGTSAPRLDSAAVEAALADRPDALHVGTLGLVLEPIASTLAGAVAATDPGTLVMIDPNIRPAAIEDRDAYTDRLFRMLGRADVVKASREDLDWLWPDVPIDMATQRLVEAGARVAIGTDGDRSVRCRSAEFAFDLPVPAVEVVDTVGAGDAFGGGFLARWMELGLGRDGLNDQMALRDAIGLATEVASRTCMRRGADPPRRSELSERLRRNAVP